MARLKKSLRQAAKIIVIRLPTCAATLLVEENKNSLSLFFFFAYGGCLHHLQTFWLNI
ncbi:hypothetical protein EXN66_Car018253 [Channa argus]|uniref:Uncharacterized protein n=1 Tax=Channa argus TaxID=215402 RepID=A0A6G1QJ46_CHAAH|nr:hypothetical protein EXN66_Car018253 [Channa argus]